MQINYSAFSRGCIKPWIFEGIGIGLANVNRIMARHGEKCWKKSEVGHGATFLFSVSNS